jgi:DNA-binding transcriptional regulator YhcF (GntR family)
LKPESWKNLDSSILMVYDNGIVHYTIMPSGIEEGDFMLPFVEIDKSSDTPVYRQIIEKISILVRNGSLQPGDRIPPERELAETLGIARGTIKKAYEELARSLIIEMSQGRGSFVSYRQDIMESGRKERAVRLIEDLIKTLEDLRFSYREIKNLIDIKILEREEQRESFHIAAVDCNPESLGIYQHQLGFISRLTITKILLDDLARDADPERKLRGFDLIVSTATHYTELLGMVPGLREKVIQVVVSPSQEAIINLAAIKPGQRVGIVCESRQFLTIIRNKLKDFGIAAGSVTHVLAPPGEDVTSFLNDVDTVILPPGHTIGLDRENKAAVQAFMDRGGRVIRFDYQIERGSLLHLEERIKTSLES